MFRRTPVQQVIQIVLVAVTLVILSVRRPPVATYAPTPPMPRDAGRALVGPVLKDQCGRGFGQLLDSVAPPPPSKSTVQQGR